MSLSTTRLYLVTPPAFEPAAFASLLARILDAGDVAALRVRLPGADETVVARAVSALLPLTQARDLALLIDDDTRLARKLGCDGVHVAAAAVADARAVLGDAVSIGAACGSSYDAAMNAAEAGADYVAFGPTVGPNAVAAETVHDWATGMVVPCVIGGGLTLQNATAWIATQAEFLAIGRALWAAPDGAPAALRGLNQLLADAAEAASA